MDRVDRPKPDRTYRQLAAAANMRDRHLRRQVFHARYVVAVLRAAARARTAA